MNRLALLPLLLCSLLLAPTTRADDAPKAEEGFTPLFNGKDLTGWIYGKVKKKDGTEGENKAGKGYQVKDGVLFCTPGDGGNLYTEKEYANFVYRFDFKLSESANNGIAIRAPLTGDSAYAGMEVQVLDDNGKKYKDKEGKTVLKPTQFHGSIYNLFPAKTGHLRPVGEWNTEEIRVEGNKITVTLNGTVINEADLSTVTDPAVLKRQPGVKNAKGHIGFLGHGAHVEFRNMRIKELP